MATISNFNVITTATIADGDKLNANILIASGNDENMLQGINAVSATIESVYNTIHANSAKEWANSAIVGFSAVEIENDGVITKLNGAVGPAFNGKLHLQTDDYTYLKFDHDKNCITFTEDDSFAENMYKKSYLYYLRNIHHDVNNAFTYNDGGIALLNYDVLRVSSYDHQTPVKFKGKINDSFVYMNDTQATGSTAYISATNKAVLLNTYYHENDVYYDIDNSFCVDSRQQVTGLFPIHDKCISIFRQNVPAFIGSSAVRIKGGYETSGQSICYARGDSNNNLHVTDRSVSVLSVLNYTIPVYVDNESQDFCHYGLYRPVYINNKSFNIYQLPISANDCSINIQYYSNNYYGYALASAINLGTLRYSQNMGTAGSQYASDMPGFNQNINIGWAYNQNVGIPYTPAGFNIVSTTDLASDYGKCMSLQAVGSVQCRKSIFLKGGVNNTTIMPVKDCIITDTVVASTDKCYSLTSGLNSLIHVAYTNIGSFSQTNYAVNSLTLGRVAPTTVSRENSIVMFTSNSHRSDENSIVINVSHIDNEVFKNSISVHDDAYAANERGDGRYNCCSIYSNVTVHNSNSVYDMFALNSVVASKFSRVCSANVYVNSVLGFDLTAKTPESNEKSTFVNNFLLNSYIETIANTYPGSANNVIIESSAAGIFDNSFLYNTSSNTTPSMIYRQTKGIFINTTSYFEGKNRSSISDVDYMPISMFSNTADTNESYLLTAMMEGKSNSSYNSMSVWNSNFTLDNEGYLQYIKFTSANNTDATSIYNYAVVDAAASLRFLGTAMSIATFTGHANIGNRFTFVVV